MKSPKSKKGQNKRSGEPHVEPFDIWLKRGLHQIYDEVASEPIPDDLLKLIEDDRQK